MLTQEQAERIVRALDKFQNGEWKWLDVDEEPAKDARWIAKRYSELKETLDFDEASLQARVQFILIVAGHPALSKPDRRKKPRRQRTRESPATTPEIHTSSRSDTIGVQDARHQSHPKQPGPAHVEPSGTRAGPRHNQQPESPTLTSPPRNNRRAEVSAQRLAAWNAA